MLKEGEAAPDFTLPSTTGHDVTLSENRGGVVILYFYPKNNTAGCTWEARSFRAQFEMFAKHKATVYGISRDNIEDHCEFQGKEGLPFELLSDADGKVHELFGAWKKTLGMTRVRRCTYIIDPEGKVAKTYPSVMPIAHARSVVMDMERLGDAQKWW